eukprot:TRINITY_DN99691_c0_g1_i1.p1 TRINITY_DN99691_c0_g1~~TRINITY_DN99691_c0_g1_i1.p1  ORF type:complete len:356 (+),score=87.56 TRINITY_DN99691_c0_g1_i1:84-1151(+)
MLKEPAEARDLGSAQGPSDELPHAPEAFEDHVRKQLQASALSQDYSDLVERTVSVVCSLRARLAGEKQSIWTRLYKGGRMLKEFTEALPVVAEVLKDFGASAEYGQVTFIDLCSGVGYVSMLLAELLRGNSSVARFVLVDHQWPLLNAETKPHHINPEHLHCDLFDAELVCRRYDLKKSTGQHYLQEHVIQRAPGPVMLLGIHLCGLLSLKAVQIFNDNPRCTFLAVKPCCLPSMALARQKYQWTVGGHVIDAKDVCAEGKYNKNQWKGPPKAQLRKTFCAWVANLLESTSVHPSGSKRMADVQLVRTDEGFEHYQTLFVFASRAFSALDGTVSNIGGPPSTDATATETDVQDEP